MNEVRVIHHQESDREQAEKLEALLNWFWEHGGREKYIATKPARDANRIPDSQWFKANIMGIVDDAEIQYDYGNDKSK